VRKCNIETGRTPPVAASDASAYLRVMSVRVESDGVSPEALADFKRQVPGQDRHWAGKEADESKRDFAWYVRPDHLPAVCAWATQWYEAAFLKAGPRETNLHNGRTTEERDLFASAAPAAVPFAAAQVGDLVNFDELLAAVRETRAAERPGKFYMERARHACDLPPGRYVCEDPTLLHYRRVK
jgi:hypothetical protein